MSESSKVELKEFGVNIWWHIPTFVKDAVEAQELLELSGFEVDDLPTPSKKLSVSRSSWRAEAQTTELQSPAYRSYDF